MSTVPVVVQVGTKGVGDINTNSTVTLASVPTPGNLLVYRCAMQIANMGNAVLQSGWFTIGNAGAGDVLSLARWVQPGDGKNQTPSVGSGFIGSAFGSAVCYEISGVDQTHPVNYRSILTNSGTHPDVTGVGRIPSRANTLGLCMGTITRYNAFQTTGSIALTPTFGAGAITTDLDSSVAQNKCAKYGHFAGGSNATSLGFNTGYSGEYTNGNTSSSQGESEVIYLNPTLDPAPSSPVPGQILNFQVVAVDDGIGLNHGSSYSITTSWSPAISNTLVVMYQGAITDGMTPTTGWTMLIGSTNGGGNGVFGPALNDGDANPMAFAHTVSPTDSNTFHFADAFLGAFGGMVGVWELQGPCVINNATTFGHTSVSGNNYTTATTTPTVTGCTMLTGSTFVNNSDAPSISVGTNWALDAYCRVSATDEPGLVGTFTHALSANVDIVTGLNDTETFDAGFLATAATNGIASICLAVAPATATAPPAPTPPSPPVPKFLNGIPFNGYLPTQWLLKIYDTSGNLVDIPQADVVSIDVEDVMNGGSGTGTFTFQRPFNNIGKLAFDYRFLLWIWNADENMPTDPYWAGSMVDLQQTQNVASGTILAKCEGDFVLLNRAIITMNVNPNVGTNPSLDCGQFLSKTLFPIYLDAALFPNVSVPAIMFNLQPFQFNGTKLATALDTLTKMGRDVSGNLFTWHVQTHADLSRTVIVQADQNPNVVGGLKFKHVFKDEQTSRYDIQTKSRDVYNIVSVVGGKDPVTGQTAFGVFSDPVSVATYGPREDKVQNQYLLTNAACQSYASVYLDLHGYPEAQGSFDMLRFDYAIKAGTWLQLWEAPQSIDGSGDTDPLTEAVIKQVRCATVKTKIQNSRVVQTISTQSPVPYLDEAIYRLGQDIKATASTATKPLAVPRNLYLRTGAVPQSTTSGRPASVSLNPVVAIFPTAGTVSAGGATLQLTDNSGGPLNAQSGDGYYTISLNATGTYTITKGDVPHSPTSQNVLGVTVVNGVPLTADISTRRVSPDDVNNTIPPGGGLAPGTVTTSMLASGVLKLANDADVALTTLSNGQVLTWSASASSWINSAPVAGSTTLAADTDVALTTLSDAQVLTYDGATSKWKNKVIPTPTVVRRVCLKLSGFDFTPGSIGTDSASTIEVPYDPLTGATIAWTVTRIDFILMTTGSTASSVKVQRSTSDPFTNANYLNTTALTVAGAAYRANTTSIANPTVNSGDQLRCEWTALGTSAAGFSAYVYLEG